ncbi:MAG: ASCH domain-containing protein [Candidatus Saccharibacteria bacterium]
MSTYHNHRSEPYFTFLKNGQKTIEGRLRKDKYAQIQAGDYIEVFDTNESESVKVIVKRVAIYPSIKAMLETEDYKQLLPNAESITNGIEIYRKFYTPEQELEFGMTAIEVEIIK